MKNDTTLFGKRKAISVLLLVLLFSAFMTPSAFAAEREEGEAEFCTAAAGEESVLPAEEIAEAVSEAEELTEATEETLIPEEIPEEAPEAVFPELPEELPAEEEANPIEEAPAPAEEAPLTHAADFTAADGTAISLPAEGSVALAELAAQLGLEGEEIEIPVHDPRRRTPTRPSVRRLRPAARSG